MNKSSLPPAASVAITLRQQLEQLHTQESCNRHARCLLLTEKLERLSQLTHSMDRARRLQYAGSARRLQVRYDRQLTDLVPELQSFLSTPAPAPGRGPGSVPAPARIASRGYPVGRLGHSVCSQPYLPKPQRIVAELNQLADDFGHWTHEPPGCTVSVITERVVLEGIDFGRFRLSLDISQVADPTQPLPVRVEAMEPNPAAGSDHVTHPHVSDNRLCPGDATAPLGRALREGRLADFFLVLRSVLHTYNPDSAYVELDNWDHAACCHDCGCSMHPDETCWCELCERDFCDECVSICQGCHETTCFSCLVECDHCEESYCSRCIESCSGCGASSCPGCLEDQLCPICQEAKETEDDHEEITPEESPTHAGSNRQPDAA